MTTRDVAAVRSAGAGRRAGRLLGLALLGGLAAGAPGCTTDDRVERFPVAGRVEVGGEPASGAFVVFHPVDPSALPPEAGRPSAQVQPDGTFALTTFDEADGAPAGTYAVTVEWRKLVGEGFDARPGPNVVPEDYTKAATTPVKVTVGPGENPPAEIKIAKVAGKAGRR